MIAVARPIPHATSSAENTDSTILGNIVDNLQSTINHHLITSDWMTCLDLIAPETPNHARSDC